MDAVALEGVEIDRQSRHQGLTLAGLHLGDRAFIEDNAAHHLNVEMTLTEGSFGRFANGGEGRRQQVLQFLAARQFLLEVIGSGAQFIIGTASQCPVRAR